MEDDHECCVGKDLEGGGRGLFEEFDMIDWGKQ
jgi:hypothetical protein